jgi:hypothetical protein
MKTPSVAFIEEEKHLEGIVSALTGAGKHYLACQVAHLAGILKNRSQSVLPILRWGYLLTKGFLSEPEATALLPALYTEVRGSDRGKKRLLSILSGCQDAQWLSGRLREEMTRQEDHRKTNLTYQGEIHEGLQRAERHDEEMAIEEASGE